MAGWVRALLRDKIEDRLIGRCLLYFRDTEPGDIDLLERRLSHLLRREILAKHDIDMPDGLGLEVGTDPVGEKIYSKCALCEGKGGTSEVVGAGVSDYRRCVRCDGKGGSWYQPVRFNGVCKVVPVPKIYDRRLN